MFLKVAIIIILPGICWIHFCIMDNLCLLVGHLELCFYYNCVS
uniref:Uncharacterized protein n=1 Tax=Rhizophora mucronata TaxID=61149 RepID=A0A2P2LP70_RHIMU